MLLCRKIYELQEQALDCIFFISVSVKLQTMASEHNMAWITQTIALNRDQLTYGPGMIENYRTVPLYLICVLLSFFAWIISQSDHY